MHVADGGGGPAPRLQRHTVVDEAVVVEVLDERPAEGHVEDLVAAAHRQQQQLELDGDAGAGEVERVVVGGNGRDAGSISTAPQRRGSTSGPPGRHSSALTIRTHVPVSGGGGSAEASPAARGDR